jgi:BTB/POZ domain
MAKLITNHVSLYFNDGNITLLAPQSQNRYLAFRVHRSMLSRISPVFEGLFSIPAVDETEKYEGTPVMYMMDRADALQRLLQLVYHDVYVCPRRTCRMAVLPFVLKKFTT